MTRGPSSRTSLILPVGTQVVSRVEVVGSRGEPVCPVGAVGVVAEAPTDGTHSYEVRLSGGAVVALKRDELSIRKHAQRDDLRQAPDSDLYERVIYRCVVGSRAYGLEEQGSDTDRRGIYLPPAHLHWSLYGVPEQLENDETQEVYWELQKFLILALKANPNILECLYTPLVEEAGPLAEELLGMRSVFLSRLVHGTYSGYVMSQFKRMERDLRNKGQIKWKHAMHLIRLLHAGIAVLNEGFLPVNAHEHREELLAIRCGEVPFEEINARRLALHKEFDKALAGTKLPDRPDYEKANDFLVKARRSAADERI